MSLTSKTKHAVGYFVIIFKFFITLLDGIPQPKALRSLSVGCCAGGAVSVLALAEETRSPFYRLIAKSMATSAVTSLTAINQCLAQCKSI